MSNILDEQQQIASEGVPSLDEVRRELLASILPDELALEAQEMEKELNEYQSRKEVRDAA